MKEKNGFLFPMIMIIVMLDIAFIAPILEYYDTSLFIFVAMFCAVISIVLGGALWQIYKLGAVE